jgi:hypothetical protein
MNRTQYHDKENEKDNVELGVVVGVRTNANSKSCDEKKCEKQTANFQNPFPKSVKWPFAK